MRANSISSASVISRITAGTSVSPAMRAARQRRSPATMLVAARQQRPQQQAAGAPRAGRWSPPARRGPRCQTPCRGWSRLGSISLIFTLTAPSVLSAALSANMASKPLPSPRFFNGHVHLPFHRLFFRHFLRQLPIGLGPPGAACRNTAQAAQSRAPRKAARCGE